MITDRSGFECFLISGKQIVTQENLEILGLGMEGEVEDGMDIDRVIEKVIEAGCLPVLPWGFGKWTGDRGKVVDKLVGAKKYSPFFVGDNGNRPRFMKMPEQLTTGMGNSMRNLQGSDPLPFRHEAEKVGSFGVQITGTLSKETPFDSLYQILSEEAVDIEPYGDLESALRFVKNQVAMQIVKRLR